MDEIVKEPKGITLFGVTERTFVIRQGHSELKLTANEVEQLIAIYKSVTIQSARQ